MKTIYNVYVPITSQKQADRIRQLCIDNNLPIWKNSIAFEVSVKKDDDYLSYCAESKTFFVFGKVGNEEDFLNINKATEQEFIELLKSTK